MHNPTLPAHPNHESFSDDTYGPFFDMRFIVPFAVAGVAAQRLCPIISKKLHIYVPLDGMLLEDSFLSQAACNLAVSQVDTRAQLEGLIDTVRLLALGLHASGAPKPDNKDAEGLKAL